MSLLAIAQRIKARSATPATPEKNVGLQPEPASLLACTLATPETPVSVDTRSESANDAPSLPDALDAATLAAAAASLLLARAAARQDRDAFALKNHAEAIRHFRKMATETERLAAMYRAKIDGHTEAARKRLTLEEFDEWISKI